MKIEYFREGFRPFGTRGEDLYAVRLRGNHFADVRLFRALLAVLKARHTGLGNLSVEKRNHNAGGWLPTWHRWFVEPVVWLDVVSFYGDVGVEMTEVEPKSMGDLRLESIRSERRQNLKYYGTPEPSREQFYAGRRVVG